MREEVNFLTPTDSEQHTVSQMDVINLYYKISFNIYCGNLLFSRLISTFCFQQMMLVLITTTQKHYSESGSQKSHKGKYGILLKIEGMCSAQLIKVYCTGSPTYSKIMVFFLKGKLNLNKLSKNRLNAVSNYLKACD